MSISKIRHKYDAEQDRILKAWKDDTIGILAGIYSYKGGVPKFQIGPRLSWKKNASGDLYPITLRIGRLNKDDLVWLKTIIDDAINTFDDLRETRFVEGEYKGGIAVGNDGEDLSRQYELAEQGQVAK